ncbi:MAG TPA: HypC/HybG/HupF family hydrogenase formation chaperone [Candidatus Bathyarchaeota archaeon]|nr:HypC/HybG/HupF family hydrogenase formation chaperone [Candidatus Bathyarchaeota archaeon]
MCLAVPAKLLAIGPDDEGIVDFGGGVKRKVNLMLLDKSKLKPGETYIIVHAGFGISILDREEAEKTLKIWREILEAEAQQEKP